MALTITGVAGSAFDNGTWEKMMAAIAPPSVATGLATTAKSSSTRTVTVAAGSTYQAGSWAVLDAPADVTFAANASGQTRIDLVCIRVDGSQTPSAQATTPVVKQGIPAASPLTPATTQIAGGVWETPIARVIVANGAGQLTSSNIVDVRPLRSEKVCSGTVVLSDGGSAPSTVTVVYPRGFFSSTPRVQLSMQSGASSTTISNVWANNIDATTFNANISRTTTTACTVMWTATGF